MRWILGMLVACSSASPDAMRVDFDSEDHHRQTFTTLHVSFHHAALLHRLDEVTVAVHARCTSGKQVFEDELVPLAPMIMDDDDERVVRTTDDLEGDLFRYSEHPLFGVPDACDVAVTATSRIDKTKLVLATRCLHRDHSVTSGKC